jgi:breast cancer 2 susceptibility protein
MAPWHAKLGFHRSPFIATLNSLTPDGGNVAVVAVEVTKVITSLQHPGEADCCLKSHPIAYVEFIEDENGKRMEGPRGAKEENGLSEQWRVR